MLQSQDIQQLNDFKKQTTKKTAYKSLTSDLKTQRREGQKKVFHSNGNKKKAEVAILISDKIDSKIKTVTKDKEGHYMLIKGPIQQEGI